MRACLWVPLLKAMGPQQAICLSSAEIDAGLRE